MSEICLLMVFYFTPLIKSSVGSSCSRVNLDTECARQAEAFAQFLLCQWRRGFTSVCKINSFCEETSFNQQPTGCSATYEQLNVPFVLSFCERSWNFFGTSKDSVCQNTWQSYTTNSYTVKTNVFSLSSTQLYILEDG